MSSTHNPDEWYNQDVEHLYIIAQQASQEDTIAKVIEQQMSIEPRASDSCDYSAGITSPLASCPARNTRSRRTNNTGKVNGTQPGKQGKRKMKEPSPPSQSIQSSPLSKGDTRAKTDVRRFQYGSSLQEDRNTR